ncbi:MAG: DUF3916 domain-containing protein [Candidatus Eremiobacteraeota bacterium]|nr:DUF3916 domain-containing protein [Candidatus Eremiobacteraeota bacterium]
MQTNPFVGRAYRGAFCVVKRRRLLKAERRLNIAGKFVDPKPHVAALERWAREFDNEYPSRPMDGQMACAHWKIPILNSVVREHATKSTLIRSAQALLDVASKLAEIKPAKLRHTRVAVILPTWNMFSSSVEVFFDSRSMSKPPNSEYARYRRLPRTRSLVREWKLRVPRSFREVGYLEIYDARDDLGLPPRLEGGESWLIGELPGWLKPYRINPGRLAPKR